MPAQGQRGREAQATVEALGGALIAFVLRYVPLELGAVARDEATLRTAELSFETLRRGRSEVRGGVRLLPPGGARRSFRYMSLERSDVIQSDSDR